MRSRLMSVTGVMLFWIMWPYLVIHFRFTKRTRVLVVVDNAILLIKTWPSPGNLWSLPGGGIRRTEQTIVSAQRELREETGLMIDTSMFEPLLDTRFRELGYSYPCSYFVVRLDARPKISLHFPEVVASTWAPIDQLSEYPLGAEVHQALTAYRALVQ